MLQKRYWYIMEWYDDDDDGHSGLPLLGDDTKIGARVMASVVWQDTQVVPSICSSCPSSCICYMLCNGAYRLWVTIDMVQQR